PTAPLRSSARAAAPGRNSPWRGPRTPRCRQPSTPSPGTPGPRCGIPARSKTPTPGPGSLMPRSPKFADTAFASTDDAITARLIVRRVKDLTHTDALFPVWRYHPFFTNSTEPVTDADLTHRRHAIIETVFADLIDGPPAHVPSGRFGANCAWA